MLISFEVAAEAWPCQGSLKRLWTKDVRTWLLTYKAFIQYRSEDSFEYRKRLLKIRKTLLERFLAAARSDPSLRPNFFCQSAHRVLARRRFASSAAATSCATEATAFIPHAPFRSLSGSSLVRSNLQYSNASLDGMLLGCVRCFARCFSHSLASEAPPLQLNLERWKDSCCHPHVESYILSATKNHARRFILKGQETDNLCGKFQVLSARSA